MGSCIYSAMGPKRSKSGFFGGDEPSENGGRLKARCPHRAISLPQRRCAVFGHTGLHLEQMLPSGGLRPEFPQANQKSKFQIRKCTTPPLHLLPQEFKSAIPASLPPSRLCVDSPYGIRAGKFSKANIRTAEAVPSIAGSLEE